MARWEFKCPQCQELFSHSEPASGSLVPSIGGVSKTSVKTERVNGIHLQCPHCGITSLYDRRQSNGTR
jgi:predicted RNA-binding Zn-ribbon protein involved in translation (DUF1610 family)